MIGWCCTNFLKVAVFSSCFRLLNHLYLGATLANLNWECLAEIDPPLASTSRIWCWTGTPWEHPWFMLRTSISIYQYLTSVEAILKRICFVLEVLNITIAHHQGFRHVHHRLLGKIMSHLGDESSPPKKDLLFLQCHGQCFGYVACVGKCIKQLLKWRPGTSTII